MLWKFEIMRTKVFITGTSSGIGLAIAEKLLLTDAYEVVGIGRRHTINHPRYIPVTADLSDFEATKTILFEADSSFSKIVLINNAGRIGAIQRVGSLSDDDIDDSIQLNLTAVIQLTNYFLSAFGRKDDRQQIILNISSGAGKNPTTYDGLESIAEIHPSIKSADIFPKMRTLTEDDLVAIAGHILTQPKIVAEKWGGGKIYY